MKTPAPGRHNREKVSDPLGALLASTEIICLPIEQLTVSQFLHQAAGILRKHYACTSIHLWMSHTDADGHRDIVGSDPNAPIDEPLPEPVLTLAHTAYLEQSVVSELEHGPSRDTPEDMRGRQTWNLAFPLLTAECALGAAVLHGIEDPDLSSLTQNVLRTLGIHIGTLIRYVEQLQVLRKENSQLIEAHARLLSRTEQLEATYAQLKRLDEAKTGFITVASHELRTPLTVLSGYSQMLASDPIVAEDAYRMQLVQGIQRGANRLRTIVDDMLDMARIDSHTLQIQPEPLFPAILIKSIHSSLHEILSERAVTFTLDPSLDKLPMIEADIDGLRKVFYHLMVNAIKYTPDGGRVWIWGREIKACSPSSERCIEIIISDTGIGIDPELQDLIFAKFYPMGGTAFHSSGSGKFKGGGPGLGLAIARGIVEAHGGRIWVESPGHDEIRCPGSDFHVVLPVRAASDTEIPEM